MLPREGFLAVGPFRPEMVTAEIAGDFAFPPEVENHRLNTWKEFRAKNPAAFDGSLARLQSFDLHDGQISLRLQRTTFSSYIASRMPDFADRFSSSGRSDPIGITVVTLGTDGNVLVTRRSLLAEQNPGGIYFVGGYADGHDDGPMDMFEEARRELREEIGFDEADKSGSRLLGIAYDPVHCHPEATILLRPRASIAEMLAHLSKAADAAEAHAHHAVSLASILDGSAIIGPKTWSFSISSELLRRAYPDL